MTRYLFSASKNCGPGSLPGLLTSVRMLGVVSNVVKWPIRRRRSHGIVRIFIDRTIPDPESIANILYSRCSEVWKSLSRPGAIGCSGVAGDGNKALNVTSHGRSSADNSISSRRMSRAFPSMTAERYDVALPTASLSSTIFRDYIQFPPFRNSPILSLRNLPSAGLLAAPAVCPQSDGIGINVTFGINCDS